MALIATYWDDSWHTDRGRDSFWVPPHIALYGGVTLVALAVGIWWWNAGSRVGRRGALGSDPLLARAVLSVAAIAVSAPIDELWHQMYGRDAVLWSPPHLLALMATVLMAASLFVATTRIDSVAGPWLQAGTAGLLIGALLVPVMEYESDVPQFPVALYLPVLCAGFLTAAGVIRRARPETWFLTKAAISYSALRAVVVVFLASAGFSTPIVSPVILLAVVTDLLVVSRRSLWWLALLVPAVAHALYAVWLPAVPNGVEVRTGDLVAGLTLAVAASLAALVLSWDIRRPRDLSPASRSAAGLAVLALALILITSNPASAHDPGQGRPWADATVVGVVDGHQAELIVTLDSCTGLRPLRTRARRAGRVEEGPLRAGGRECQFEGTVATPADGRWFVYAELESETGQALELWIPIQSGAPSRHEHRRELYVAETTGASFVQVVAGAVLTLAAVALLILAARTETGRTAGRARPPTPSGVPDEA